MNNNKVKADAILLSLNVNEIKNIFNEKQKIIFLKKLPRVSFPLTIYIYCPTAKKPVYDGEGENKLLIYCKDDLALLHRLGREEKIGNPYGCLSKKEQLLNGCVVGKVVVRTYKYGYEYIGKDNKIFPYALDISSYELFKQPLKISNFMKYGYEEVFFTWNDSQAIGIRGCGKVSCEPKPDIKMWCVKKPPSSYIKIENEVYI